VQRAKQSSVDEEESLGNSGQLRGKRGGKTRDLTKTRQRKYNMKIKNRLTLRKQDGARRLIDAPEDALQIVRCSRKMDVRLEGQHRKSYENRVKKQGTIKADVKGRVKLGRLGAAKSDDNGDEGCGRKRDLHHGKMGVGRLSTAYARNKECRGSHAGRAVVIRDPGEVNSWDPWLKVHSQAQSREYKRPQEKKTP